MIQFVLLVDIKDRPERSKATGFGFHNGKYTSCWSWVSVFNHRLISCNICFKKRCNRINTGDSMKCSRCYDWNYSNVNITLPKDYPTSASTKKSHRVTYESTKKTAVSAHTNLHNVRAKKWNKVSSKAYLTLEGFNG